MANATYINFLTTNCKASFCFARSVIAHRWFGMTLATGMIHQKIATKCATSIFRCCLTAFGDATSGVCSIALAAGLTSSIGDSRELRRTSKSSTCLRVKGNKQAVKEYDRQMTNLMRRGTARIKTGIWLTNGRRIHPRLQDALGLRVRYRKLATG
jgi:hypothetical protein